MKISKYLLTFFIMTLCVALHAELVDHVIATVNDDEITMSDLKNFRKKIVQGEFVDEILLPDEESRKDALGDEKKLLQVKIDEKILDNEVKLENLQATIEQVEQRIRAITQKNRISRADLKRALAEQGSSFSEYQAFIKTQLERQSLIGKHVKSKIHVSDDEVAAAYLAKRPQSSKESFEYKVSHILFLIEKKEDEGRAKSRIELVRGKLRENKSFESLVAEYTDEDKPAEGGFFGTFRSGEMSKDFETALKGLQPGEISEPVRSRAGIHLLKLNVKKLIADPQFESEKEKLRPLLEQQAYQKQFKFWLEQRRAEAAVKVNAL